MSSAAATDEASSAAREVSLSITGMTCAACAARVEKKLNALDGVVATVNFATERALVRAPSSIAHRRLIEVVEQAGYGAVPVRRVRLRNFGDAPGAGRVRQARSPGREPAEAPGAEPAHSDGIGPARSPGAEAAQSPGLGPTQSYEQVG